MIIMTDQTLLDSYLLLLKSTVEVYVHGTLESTNEDVHNLLNKSLNDTLYMQNTAYNEMTNYGWYKVENVKNNVIQKTIDKLRA
jgi:spore coat protein CotF